MTQPSLRDFDWEAWHRLIPSRYSESGTVLSAIVGSPAELEKVMLLDAATNERVQGEQSRLPGIDLSRRN